MASADDDVREIQLSGKQLVFLFMAVTVVSVVIFLCGVLVGRGVPSHPAADTQTSGAAAIEPSNDPTAPVEPTSTPPAEPTKTPDLRYHDELEAKTPTTDKLTTAPPAPVTPVPRAPAAPGANAPVTPPAASPAKPPPPKPAPASNLYPEPHGDGFAIQIAALTGKGEAEAVAERLKRKGYAVYVIAAPPGQPAAYKVRVGKFKARTEAEKIATRLEREEQFKPWITR